MEILLNKEELTDKLSLASKFISSGRNMPITKGILLTCNKKENILLIDASDFQHGCKIRMDAEVKKSGEVVIEGDKFIKLINSLSSEKVKLKQKKNTLKITEKDKDSLVEFKMAIFIDGPDKFPTIPIPTNDASKYNIDKEKFLSLFKQIGFAAEKENSIRDSERETYSKMLFIREGIAYATNSQKFAGIINPDTEIENFSIQKSSLSYFRNLNDNFTLYIENDIFYVQDEDFFFMVKIPITNPPTSKIRKLLQDTKEPVIKYQLNQDEVKKLTNALQQIKILNEYVTFYITENTLWLSGVDYDTSSSNSPHTSIKALKLTPKIFKEEILITYELNYFLQALKKVSTAEIVFEGGYKDLGITRIYEDNFQAALQRMVAQKEEQVLERINKFKN